MKKIITIGVIAAFLCAAMPRPANADHGRANPAALGIVAGVIVLLVAVPVMIGSFFGWKKHEKSEDTNQLIAKGQITSSAPTAFNNIPGVATFQTDDMEKPVVLTYTPIVQPIAQNVRPLRSDKVHSSGNGESKLCRAGREAALNEFPVACEPNDNSEYCLCYEAATKGR